MSGVSFAVAWGESFPVCEGTALRPCFGCRPWRRSLSPRGQSSASWSLSPARVRQARNRPA